MGENKALYKPSPVIYNLALFILLVSILKSLKNIGENISLFIGLIKGASSFIDVSKSNSALLDELSTTYL